jgi:hypothetical protein
MIIFKLCIIRGCNQPDRKKLTMDDRIFELEKAVQVTTPLSDKEGEGAEMSEKYLDPRSLFGGLNVKFAAQNWMRRHAGS